MALSVTEVAPYVAVALAASVVVLIFGLTINVRMTEGPVETPPWHAPTGGGGGNELTPMIRNVYVPGGVEPDVVTLSDVVASLPAV